MENIHVGRVDGMSCQHLQVLVTNFLHKRWEWQEEWNSVMKHGTVVRPTMYLANLDIKTAFDGAKPKHVAKILDGHKIHGWPISALLREMSGMSGKATVECVETSASNMSFMWADNFWIMSHSKENLEQILRDLIEEASRWDLKPKPASLWYRYV